MLVGNMARRWAECFRRLASGAFVGLRAARWESTIVAFFALACGVETQLVRDRAGDDAGGAPAEEEAGGAGGAPAEEETGGAGGAPAEEEADGSGGARDGTPGEPAPWHVAIVDTTPSAPGKAVIVVDETDHLHITYPNTSNELLHATDTSGEWTIDAVGPTDSSTVHSSVVDTQGHVHISHLHPETQALQYSTDSDGSWITTMVDSDAQSGGSIALDPSGFLHVSYRQGRDLKYATNAGGKWTTATIDTGRYVLPEDDWISGIIEDFTAGDASSIAVDNHGTVHITHFYHGEKTYLSSYGDETVKTAEVRYGTLVDLDGAWSFRSVCPQDGPIDGLGASSLAVDASSSAHMACAYLDRTDYEDRYEAYVSGRTALWYVLPEADSSSAIGLDERIAPAGELSPYRGPSIAVSASGVVHVMYYDTFGPLGDVLRYATNLDGDWLVSTVASECGVVSDNSSSRALAVDAAGVVHVAYHDGDGVLKRASHRP
jgi:hypothetical protein